MKYEIVEVEIDIKVEVEVRVKGEEKQLSKERERSASRTKWITKRYLGSRSDKAIDYTVHHAV
jgi:hypothetical protein